MTQARLRVIRGQAAQTAAGLPPLVMGGGATIAEQVYRYLRDALIYGELRSGQPLSGRAIAEKLAVSKTPVQDAIQQLVREDGLRPLPSGRPHVPVLSAGEVEELRDLASHLDALLYSTLAERLTPEDIADLLSIEKEWSAATRGAQGLAASRDARRFHFRLYAAARMPHLARILEGLWVRTGPHRHLVEDTLRAMRRKHRDSFMRCVCAGDFAQARQIQDETRRRFYEGWLEVARRADAARPGGGEGQAFSRDGTFGPRDDS